ncbi:hypothetical protein ACIBCM_14325 [Streptomyces sp. NPDC051018]
MSNRNDPWIRQRWGGPDPPEIGPFGAVIAIICAVVLIFEIAGYLAGR